MTATFSPCTRYRYHLGRDVALMPGTVNCGRILFIMLNPSTADAETDDPTIRKCTGFARRAGFGRLDVVNLYAWRATDPRDLRAASVSINIIGPDNDVHIRTADSFADCIVVAWGALILGRLSRPAERRAAEIAARLRNPVCIGVTQSGHPRHPLMVPYDTPFQPYPVRPDLRV